MKSLEEVQQDLIDLEQYMSKSIKSLNYEIGMIKEAARKESGQNVFDFEKIKELSWNIRITDHPLVRLGSVEERRLYIKMLLNMVRLDADQEACLNRMIYLQWLADHSKAERSLEDLFRDSLLLTKASYTQFAKSLKEPLASVFIADALITVYISGDVSEEIKSYLFELFAIAGFSEDKVKPIASAVKKLLSGENTKFPAVGDNGLRLFCETRVGSYVKFGRYPQNNGYFLEPIEWLVLENDGKTMLVVSKYGLDCKEYDNCDLSLFFYMAKAWGDCDLRKWLNGVFLQTAFNADEQKQIAESNTESLVTDKIFCLSRQEALDYFGRKTGKCRPTSYAESRNAYKCSDGYCDFWLRTLKGNNRSVYYVSSYGGVDPDGKLANSNTTAVRPALRIIL